MLKKGSCPRKVLKGFELRDYMFSLAILLVENSSSCSKLTHTGMYYSKFLPFSSVLTRPLTVITGG